MTRRAPVMEQFDLVGLRPAPSQVWGNIRLVPLLQDRIEEDLRLALDRQDEDFQIVRLDGRPGKKGVFYGSYVPHGLVVAWEEDGQPVGSFGTALLDSGHWQKKAGRKVDLGFARVRLSHRMARKVGARRARLLPLHLAMEGFLALHFGGPDIAWSEYSRRGLRQGLSPRIEVNLGARFFAGYEDALRTFEIHENQCGVMVLIGDIFTTVFVVSHPDDYRRLHGSLIEDFLAEEIWFATSFIDSLPSWEWELAESGIETLEDLRAALERSRSAWIAFQGTIRENLLGREVVSEVVQRLGPFSLQRFHTGFSLDTDNHIGEVILRGDGSLAYARTFRLSAKQVRRAHLLEHLAQHNWNLDATAVKLGSSKDDLILRLEKAGFGYLLKGNVLEEARRRRRRGPRDGG